MHLQINRLFLQIVVLVMHTTKRYIKCCFLYCYVLFGSHSLGYYSYLYIRATNQEVNIFTNDQQSTGESILLYEYRDLRAVEW